MERYKFTNKLQFNGKVKEIISEITKIKINSNNIIQINSSSNNQIFDLGNYILKISDKNYNLRNEFEILNILNGDYFPKGLNYFEIDKHFYLIISKLKGQTLDTFWYKYTKEKQQKILGEITEKLKEIHSIKSKKFNFFMNLENKYFSNYFEVLENKLKIVKDKAFKNTFVNTERLKYLLDIFNKNKECFNLEQGVLIHNDLWYKNILSNENKLTGIIDFEKSHFATRQVELFGLERHLFSAKNYIEENPQDYEELSFINNFLNYLKNNYKELFEFPKEQKLIYDITAYISMLSKFEQNRYKHIDTEKFYLQFLNNNANKMITHN